MKKGCFINIFLIILIIGIVGSFCLGLIINNRIITLNDHVNTSWTLLEGSYQKRINLLPKLIGIISLKTNESQKELQKIEKTKDSIISIQIDPSSLSINNIKKFSQKQSFLNDELKAIQLVINNSPKLKNDPAIIETINHLDNIEESIVKNKKEYNKSVNNYNYYIQKFPNKIIANYRNYKIKGKL